MSELNAGGNGSARRRLLSGVDDGEWAYFVHSYAPTGVPDDVVLARATHGRAFPAVAGRGRVVGAQFHPERSGRAGLGLLRGFVELACGEAAAGGAPQ